MMMAPSLALALFVAQAPPTPPNLDAVEEQMRRFTRVFAAIEAEAASPVNPDAAFYGGALPAMLRRLDPHSMFLDPSQFEQLQQMEKSEQKGFGSVVSILPGRVIILQTLPGTPSSKAGLGPGDEILAVNNIPLGGLDPEQLVGLLGEARQRKALVHVRRPGNVRILDFTLTPETLASPSVDRMFFLADGIGYVRVQSFDEKTGKDVNAAIEKLGGAAKLKGLVLDLRGNPGGVMGAALETASLFLQPGQKILGVRGRRVREEDAQVANGATPYAFPLTVLMNAKSASASEIVAGALPDHKRATILGEQSYGKGLVQSVYPLSSNTAMLLTTAYYFTPNGRSIQRPLRDAQIDESLTAGRKEGGITPDEIVRPDLYTRLRAYLENSASFTAFATEYAGKNKIAEGFKVDLSLLDQFQGFLFQRNVRPGIGEWLQDKEWIRSRLEQEIVTIALGVPQGDEVELRRDPVVRAAVNRLSPQ
jgi:carboxyl-terminal processing protease